MTEEKVRLSKVMAQRGICSRREADAYIEKGWVRYDGGKLAELGVRVDPGTDIELDPRARKQQNEVLTILLNKPVAYVSGQAEKGYQPAITLITPANHYARDRIRRRFQRADLKGLAPAGRLDIDSQGLLILTQDGRVARTLVGPESRIEKEYLVRIQGQVSEQALAKLRHGLSLDGKELRAAKITQLNPDQLQFVLTEGRKRQIRRMCEQVGLKVTGLKRVRIGRVRLGALPEGEWRYLGKDERF
ncbi:MAG: pseudouridylate synthase [Thiotrichales bacterium SG8_50]|jgi:23S rRNA pseudouridine2604 synthase|nr:MAG: pseudouridylate synthase [Thiotrichales bacterium SG8_50]